MSQKKSISSNKNKQKFFHLKDNLRGGDEKLEKYLTALEVKIHGTSKEQFERAVKAFRAIVQKEKILSLYKEKQTYEKPSEKKRRKHNEYLQKQFELERMKEKEESDK